MSCKLVHLQTNLFIPWEFRDVSELQSLLAAGAVITVIGLSANCSARSISSARSQGSGADFCAVS